MKIGILSKKDESSLNNSENGNSQTKLKAVIAGGLTGAIELGISYPFDYAKTQLQLAQNKKGFRSFQDVVKTTVKTRGVVGLYRGLPVLLMLTVPRESIRFCVYEALKEISLDENGNMYPQRRFLCGFVAGICEATFVTTPMETIKVKFVRDQLQKNSKYKGIFTNGIFKIVKEQGIKGIYRGATATIIKTGSNQGIRFYVVETMKFRYRSGDPSIRIPTPMVGLFGVTAGAISVVANNPIDVIKTRMQGYDGTYKNTLDCAKKIFKKEGFPAFYKGMKIRMIRVAIDAGLTFMFYDTISEMLEPFFDTKR